MIKVTRINHKTLTINSELIELIEETPDTLITMTTGRKILVEESEIDIVEKIIEYKTKCFREVKCFFEQSDYFEEDDGKEI